MSPTPKIPASHPANDASRKKSGRILYCRNCTFQREEFQNENSAGLSCPECFPAEPLLVREKGPLQDAIQDCRDELALRPKTVESTFIDLLVKELASSGCRDQYNYILQEHNNPGDYHQVVCCTECSTEVLFRDQTDILLQCPTCKRNYLFSHDAYRMMQKLPLGMPEETESVPLPTSVDGDASDRVVHETGAVRSSSCTGLRPDLLSPFVMMSMAAVKAEGSQKYGDHNWLKGFKYSEILTHLFIHLWKWQMRDESEDHLGHALWNIAALKHFEIVGRTDLDDRAPRQLPPDVLQNIESLLKHGTDKLPTWKSV